MKKIFIFILTLSLAYSKIDVLQEDFIAPRNNINKVYISKNNFEHIDLYLEKKAKEELLRKQAIKAIFASKNISYNDFKLRIFNFVFIRKLSKNSKYSIIKKHLKKVKPVKNVNNMKVLPNHEFTKKKLSNQVLLEKGDESYSIKYKKAKQQNQVNILSSAQSSGDKLKLIKTITGNISPKSIALSNKGQFWAQNMMYQHTNTVYNRDFELIKTLQDNINLADFGYANLNSNYKGSPVEIAFSNDGKFAYVTNYKMYGKGFNNPGSDICSPQSNHDNSFVYKIDTNNFKTLKAIKVGSVPKYIAFAPNEDYIFVTNWCSYDLSIIDAKNDKEIKRIKLGRYPRGIVVDKNYAYIAVMGSTSIAKINLKDFSLTWIKDVGISPRHLSLDPKGQYLYATLNGEGKVAKIDLTSNRVLNKITTGNAPRSMDISQDGQYLYIVNYNSNTLSKVRTQDMKVVDTAKTNSKPIGIVYDNLTKQIWVACYSGSIQVFKD